MVQTKYVGKIIWISLGIIIFLALQDALGIQIWHELGAFGTPAEKIYMQQFWLFAYALIATVAITFYIITKDKSEAIALAIVPTILLWGGWEDILFYVFKGIPFFGQTMPWLYTDACWFMKGVADLMDAGTVTSTTLLVSAILSAVIAHCVYKWLKKQKW